MIIDGDDTLRWSWDIYNPPIPPDTVGSLNMTAIDSVFNLIWDPMIASDPAELQFGPVYITSTAESNVVIKNDGSYYLVVTNVELVSGTPEFEVGAIVTGDTVYAYGDSLVIPVSFTPTAPVAYSDILRIHYVEDAEETLDIPISGEGSTMGIEPATHQPEQFEISCYPNPFNAELTVRIDLQTAQDVSVNLYNIQGTKEEELWLGRMTSGAQELRWNAKDSPSGIYLLKVTGDNWNRVEKVVLIK